MQLFGLNTRCRRQLNTITQSIRKKEKEEKIRNTTRINIFLLLNHTDAEKILVQKTSVSLELSGSQGIVGGPPIFAPANFLRPSQVLCD